MKFQVGDRVMIRYWDDMCEEFGYPEDETGYGYIDLPGASFSEEMKHLCGRKASISHIYGDNHEVGLKDWDNADDTCWTYNTDMISLVEKVKRDQDSVKKMTLEEIEKELGYKFTLVSSK
jgi:hypothetical protein